MPRYKLTQKWKNDKEQQRRWELPPGSHVWCYLRHSPGDNQTIDSQEMGMRDWCAANGWIIDRVFIDEAIEGSREDREQFQAMMALSRQDVRLVDGIAVWSFSRFARDQLDSQFYKAELRKRGYVIVSKIDDVPTGEMAPIYEAFIDWKNQRFLEDLSADVKRGLNFVVEMGYWPGGNPPVGYRSEKEVMGRRRNGEPRYAGRLVKDESVAARVALAWKMKLEGNHSLQDIHEATKLYSKREHYSEFFNNLLYAGIFVYHDKRYPDTWESGKRFCDAYVTLDQFYSVQKQRAARTIDAIAPRRLASLYLLTGLLRCGQCADGGRGDIPMNGQCNPQFPTTRWYRCATKMHGRGADCDMPRVPTWRVEEAICADFTQRVMTVDYVSSALQAAYLLAQDSDTDIDSRIVSLERDIQEQKERLSRLLAVIEKKGMNDLIEQQYDHAQQRYTDLTQQLAALRGRQLQRGQKMLPHPQIERFVSENRALLLEGPTKERRDLLKHFIKRIVLYPDRAIIEYNFRIEDKGVDDVFTHFFADENRGLCVASPWGHRP